MSEKTLERIEQGQGAAEDSYRRVAAAMGLPETIFTEERYIPTLEEHIDTARKAEEQFKTTHQQISVSQLADERQLREFFGTHALLVDDSLVAHAKFPALGPPDFPK